MFEDVISKVRENGGICIAAHIYNPSGARYAYTKSAELLLEPLDKTDSQEKDNFYKKVGDAVKNELYKFNGLQVKATTESVHFGDEMGELRIPLILGSDAHHVERFGDEASISFIKMGRLDFSCLKEALQFPDCGSLDYLSFDEDYSDEWITLLCECLQCDTKFQIDYRAVSIDKIKSSR